MSFKHESAAASSDQWTTPKLYLSTLNRLKGRAVGARICTCTHLTNDHILPVWVQNPFEKSRTRVQKVAPPSTRPLESLPPWAIRVNDLTRGSRPLSECPGARTGQKCRGAGQLGRCLKTEARRPYTQAAGPGAHAGPGSKAPGRWAAPSGAPGLCGVAAPPASPAPPAGAAPRRLGPLGVGREGCPNPQRGRAGDEPS